MAHSRWVRVCHWIAVASFMALALSGFYILMVHPRLYLGHVGNDLTPALLTLPISNNHRPDELPRARALAPRSLLEDLRNHFPPGVGPAHVGRPLACCRSWRTQVSCSSFCP